MEVADVPEHHVLGVKPCKKRKRTEEDDRISNLLDAIIHHILSFLSIVDVVRTSVLMRRWKDLWIEAPSLIVDDLQVDTEDKFVNIFNSVQKMYKSMNIERHSLSVRQPFNRKAIEAWVHFAVQRNVEKLRVNAFPKKPFEGLSTYKEVFEGLSTQLNNLKHLTLLVGYDKHVFQGISHLFESCSNLEVLHIPVNDENTERMFNKNFSHSFFFNKRDLMDYKMTPLSHLLEVRIWGFRGMESEIEFVRILLEFAVILKRMIITLSDEIFVNQEMKSDIKQKLAEFKMISPDAVMYLN